MKPRKLQVTAFGPYKDTLTLDFDDLGEHGLFLLHGPTGAGKTTILDAMCFALYGGTSGGEREMKELRSDLAPDTAVARVDFEFSLGEARYRVERVPTQARPGRKTDLQHEANLFRVAPLNDQLLASGVTEVRGLVQELLGLTADQFRQVVVLPQGQFRKLLTADSKDREGILKVLFDTTDFLKLEELLVKRAKAATDRTRDCDTARQEWLKTHEVLTINDLEQKVNRWQQNGTETDELVTAGEVKRKEARLTLKHAEDDARLFESLDQATAQQVKGAATAPQRSARSQRLQEAERAAVVRPLEGPVETAVRDVEALELHSRDLAGRAETAAVTWQAALETLRMEEGRQEARTQAADRLRFLDGLKTDVRDYEAGHEQLQNQRIEVAKLQKRLDTSDAELGTLNLPGLQEALQRAEQAVQMLPELSQKVTALLKLVAAKKAQEKAEKDLGTALGAERKAQETVTVRERFWTEEKLRHALLRKRFLAEQAGLLAGTLEDGVPCAVCGSTHHPVPAVPAQDAPTQADVEQAASDEDAALDDLKLAQEAFRRASEQVSTAGQRRAELLGELGDDAHTALAALTASHQEAQQTLRTASELASQRDQANTRYDKAFNRKTDLESERTGIQGDRDRQQGSLETTERRLQELAQRLPVDTRSSTDLMSQLKQAERVVRELEAALTTSRSHEDKARTTKADTEHRANVHADLLDKGRTVLNERQATFRAAVREAEFENTDLYRAAVLEPAALALLRKQVQEDVLSEQRVQESVTRARQETEGKTLPDLTAAQRTAQTAELHYDDMVRQQERLRSELQTLEKALSRATELDMEWYDAHTGSQRLEGLAMAAKGTTGQKVSFHRYVLGACLDEVLLIASQRLRDMSRDRYELRRANDERGGLEIEVLDHYTGRARSTKSLSGGESFQAALSLALGLADVVQHRSGGRHLETVFIDEGFGSLDPEALDLAMDCLMELQSNGRLVGIISHVQELRDHVQARLEVTASPNGSTARFLVA